MSDPIELVNRAAERATLSDLLSSVARGDGAALVVRGPVGVGKTALLDSFAATVQDVTVVVTSGVESERRFPFAFLQRLLRPLAAGGGSPASANARDLERALGLREHDAASPFVIAQELLELLKAASREKPTVHVIDDAQWVDAESLEVLGYVGRRLLRERVGLVFSLRDVGDRFTLDGLAELELHGLALDHATDLLVQDTAGRLDRRIATDLARQAEGNPLVLREMARAYGDGGSVPPSLLDDALPLPERLESAYRLRLTALDPDCRELLLLHALEGGDPGTVDRAGSRRGLHTAALTAAEASGLVGLHPAFRFTSSLVRAAVLAETSAVSRREAHALLAESVDRSTRPDLHAWHLARSVTGPDESVARELESTAAHARRRGGPLAQADFLSLASRLSPDADSAGARLLDAAEAAFTAAAPLRAQALLDSDVTSFMDSIHGGRALRLRTLVAAATGRPVGAAARDLLTAASRFEATDRELCDRTSLEAMQMTVIAGVSITGLTTQEAGRSALRRIPPPRPDDDGQTLLLRGLATLAAEGHVEAAPLLRRALRAMPETDVGPEPPTWFIDGAFAAQAIWDDRGLYDWLRRCESLAREAGAFFQLRTALTCLAGAEAVLGRLADAAAHMEESQEIALALGWAPDTVLALSDPVLLAWQGDEEATAAASAASVAAAELIQAADLRRSARSAVALLHLGNGRYKAALQVALESRADDVMQFDNDALANLLEAAVRCNRREDATAALEELSVRALGSGTAWALGVLARSQALLTEDPERLYRVAIDRLSETLAHADLARAHLLYGEWLRRKRRKRSAQSQLAIAHRMFAAMGAAPFAARAHAELLAAGAHAATSGVLMTALTAQENQVVRLAADGQTNQTIATRLFISPHTVAYHLTKAFRKLGVATRLELQGLHLEDGPDKR